MTGGRKKRRVGWREGSNKRRSEGRAGMQLARPHGGGEGGGEMRGSADSTVLSSCVRGARGERKALGISWSPREPFNERGPPSLSTGAEPLSRRERAAPPTRSATGL